MPGSGQNASGHRWSELDQPAPPYRQSEYGSSRMETPWDDDPASGYSWMSRDNADGGAWPSFGQDAQGSRTPNAIRGLPPVPDEPLPIYPPGPFAAWNKGPSDRSQAADSDAPGYRDRSGDAYSRAQSAATITPDEFDTNHSLPAIKDPILTQGRTSGSTVDRAPARGSRGSTRTDVGRRAAPAPGRSAPTRGTRVATRSGRKPAGGKSKRQPVRLAIATAVVIIAAVTAILVITSLGKPASNPNAGNPPHTPGRSTNTTPTSPPGKWGYIGTRATDPTPLGVREIFPTAFRTPSGVYFHATAKKAELNCGNALIGGVLQAAVRTARCSQALRASYVARLDNAMATIGVFNLATSAGASTAALHAGQATFVAPLASKDGVTSKLGQGTGIEEALVKGHYLILVWAEKIDLTSPKNNYQRQQLTAFMNTLIQATVDGGLSYRMVNGTPMASPSH